MAWPLLRAVWAEGHQEWLAFVLRSPGQTVTDYATRKDLWIKVNSWHRYTEQDSEYRASHLPSSSFLRRPYCVLGKSGWNGSIQNLQ